MTNTITLTLTPRIARDRDTGRILTADEARIAADNPGIYTWVEFIDSES